MDVGRKFFICVSFHLVCCFFSLIEIYPDIRRLLFIFHLNFFLQISTSKSTVFSVMTLLMFKYLAAAIVWIVLIGVIIAFIAATTILW